MAIAFAGLTATERLGMQQDLAADADHVQAKTLAHAAADQPGVRATALLNMALRRAQDLVQVPPHGAAIRDLAQALLKRDVIPENNVIALVKRAMHFRTGLIDAAERFIRGETVDFQGTAE